MSTIKMKPSAQKSTLLFAAAMAMAGLSSAWAQETNGDDEFFGMDEAALVANIEDTGMAESSASLLVFQSARIGGNLEMSAGASADAGGLSSLFSGDETAAAELDLSAVLFVDARPSELLRVFAKGQADYPFDEASDFALRELFADLTVSSIFIRTGKQTINWGVGHFFSPANVINLGNKDPENPDSELIGPTAVKLQAPAGSSNWYAYAILQDMEEKDTAGLAARVEWVVGMTEMSLGGIYRPNQPWAATATASGSLWDIDLYGEAAIKSDLDRNFVTVDSTSPLGVSVETSTEATISATAGFSWSWSDDTGKVNISLSGQYYWNGSGYADSGLFVDHADGVMALLASGTISPADLYQRGRQYGAVSLGFSDIGGTDLGLSAFWLGNIDDGSGKLTPSLTYTGIENVKLSVFYTRIYGESGGEFSPTGPSGSIGFRVALSGVGF